MLRDFEVPAAIAARARSWLDGERPSPAEPRPAATVVLVRSGSQDAPNGVQGLGVFLMQRRTTMAFAAGMWVFPGGGVDPRDATADVPWVGTPVERWAQVMGTDDAHARALVCAAVRETFEECGVLLASRPGEADVVDVAADRWESDRDRLLHRRVALSELLQERGLVLRADLLRPWAHWTTPVFEPRRYDTWFLLAALPTGQAARHLSTEASAARWWAVDDVLSAADAGTLDLLPPTRVTLEELAAVGSVEAAWTGRRTLTEVVPELIELEGAAWLRARLP